MKSTRALALWVFSFYVGPPLCSPAQEAHRGKSETVATIIALAKSGTTQEQQELWCLSLTDNFPIENFGYVGGWYSIQALREFLTPEGPRRSHNDAKKHKHDDFGYLPLRYSAIKTLAAIVPSPPVKFDPDSIAQAELDRSAKIWQDWIAAHKLELSKLEPTGEGVDFSDKACKNGKPTKKHKD